MIKFNEPAPVQLESRLGRVGSVHSFDLWQFRESRESMIEGVAQIASLSYGNEAAKNPQQLFDRIISLGHLSCLEFVPFPYLCEGKPCLPSHSLRESPSFSTEDYQFGDDNGENEYPATGFLVECPVFVARQWMRHRSFSYLEMSRRYVKDSKVPVKFYGEDRADSVERRIYSYVRDYINEIAIDNNEPAELARRVIPVGMMTKFYVGGYDSDWHKFVALRTDAHAQPEIRVFAEHIKGVINACK